MGGEKLKKYRLFCLFFALLFIFPAFFSATALLFAQDLDLSQTEESLPEEDSVISPTTIDETSIILGETIPAPIADGGSSFGVIFQMILVLALSALAIYGVVYFLKKVSRPPAATDPHIRVLAKTPLGTDAAAYVLSVGAKAWLVGGGSGGMNLISEIDDAEILETMLIEDAEKIAAEANRKTFTFRSLLGRMAGGAGNAGITEDAGSAEIAESAKELRRQRERLRGAGNDE